MVFLLVTLIYYRKCLLFLIIQLLVQDVLGEMGLKSCDYALSWLSNPTRYQVNILKNPKSISLAISKPALEYATIICNKPRFSWIYIDENLQGVYEIPVTFPVLNKGLQNIRIKA